MLFIGVTRRNAPRNPLSLIELGAWDPLTSGLWVPELAGESYPAQPIKLEADVAHRIQRISYKNILHRRC